MMFVFLLPLMLVTKDYHWALGLGSNHNRKQNRREKQQAPLKSFGQDIRAQLTSC